MLGAVGAARHAGLGFSGSCGWQSCSPYFREVGQLSDPVSAPLGSGGALAKVTRTESRSHTHAGQGTGTWEHKSRGIWGAFLFQLPPSLGMAAQKHSGPRWPLLPSYSQPLLMRILELRTDHQELHFLALQETSKTCLAGLGHFNHWTFPQSPWGGWIYTLGAPHR